MVDVDDPLHPILDTPLDYDIVQLLLRCGDVAEPFIDFTLARASVRRRLRFIGPRVLQVDKAFEEFPRGLEIRDISARAIGGLNVHVQGAQGALSFWAKMVLERPVNEPELSVRPRVVRAGTELEETLMRYDPQLAQRLEWLRTGPKRKRAPVRATAEARRQGGSARYFIISTK